MLFDICIIDTDTPLYKHRTPEIDSSRKHSKRKKRLYQKAVEDRRSHFRPFVVSVDGLLRREANHFIKCIAASLAMKWEKSSCSSLGADSMFCMFSVVYLFLFIAIRGRCRVNGPNACFYKISNFLIF